LAAYTCDERCRHLAVDFQLEIIVCIKISFHIVSQFRTVYLAPEFSSITF
jgi:hypothetical protein